MAQVKAWKQGAPGEPSFPDDFEVLKKAVLQLTDLANNNNKYYAIELHQAGNKFRVFTHYGRTDDLDKKANAGVRESRYYATQSDAEDGYDSIYAQKTAKSKGYQEVQLASSKIGSPQARAQDGPAPVAVARGPAKPSSLPPEIQALIRLVYDESTTALTSSVPATITSNGIETPLGVLSPAQIEKGQDVLDEIYSELKGGKRAAEFSRLSSDFYTNIPHRLGRSRADIDAAVINNFKAFEEKQDTLQLMRDMLGVQGALFEDDADARLKALGCEIDFVSKSDPMYAQLSEKVVKSQIKIKSVRVKNIYSVKRPGEWDSFNNAVGNQQHLFHGSRIKNWTGILSRGLLMPKVVVSLGVNRTDEGWLGNGIYFADAACASAFYAQPNKQGTRLMAIARVALGEMKEYTKITYGLTAPPPGYNSCHGLRSRPGLRSQFEDDEYAVYSANQQRLEYLVEFTA